jgi:WS/DGAT/MGAT family acyltransferase
MRYARALLWDAAGDAAHTAAALPATSPAGAAHRADETRRRMHLARFLARERPHAGRHSPFDGRVGTEREVAFATVPLAPLHDAAKVLGEGATLNDAVLAIVGGGLRRWLEQQHGPLGSVRVKVPVSLHHAGDEAGNRDSFFAVAVPLGEVDPVMRLRAVHHATLACKEDHDAETLDTLLHELARVSPRLERFVERVERSPRTFALNVSNVPGPREPVAVLGARVEAMHSLAEIAERHALRVAVVSLAGTLCFGFCADPTLVHDAHAIAAGTEAEAAALIAAAS